MTFFISTISSSFAFATTAVDYTGEVARMKQLEIVNVLLSKGLISGMADGKFHSGTAITYKEICSDLVKLLGYADTDLTGTYPSNYISKVKSLNISENLSYKKDDRVTYRAVAVLGKFNVDIVRFS